jgi:hypothetical protein
VDKRIQPVARAIEDAVWREESRSIDRAKLVERAVVAYRDGCQGKWYQEEDEW